MMKEKDSKLGGIKDMKELLTSDVFKIYLKVQN